LGGIASSHHVDQTRPLVTQRGRERGFQLLRLFDPNAAHADGFGHQRKVRVLEIAAGVQKSACLHFHLDKAERAIAEDDDLLRQSHLRQRDEVSHHHAEAAVARHRDHLALRVCSLRAAQ
jgi:hypothetical protein